MSIPDRHKAGRSKIVPYRHGEPPEVRHARRKETNEHALDGVRKWAANRGIDLVVKNDGHHWIFRKDGKVVEWWPSSAKLVIEKRWSRGVHVHDYEQAKRRVGKALLGGKA